MPPILPGFNSGVQRILLLFFTARKRSELNALATINNCVTLLCSFAIYKRNSECVSLLLLLLLENVQSTFFSYLELGAAIKHLVNFTIVAKLFLHLGGVLAIRKFEIIVWTRYGTSVVATHHDGSWNNSKHILFFTNIIHWMPQRNVLRSFLKKGKVDVCYICKGMNLKDFSLQLWKS